jgi:hypothetical protein
MSTVGAGKYLDLVRQAMEGKLKLPAFQREWKWKRKQVVELFDSLRNQYPIGSFLTAKAGGDLNLSPRAFAFTNAEAEKAPTEQVVLDGQQRITAGIQLFYANSLDQGTHYFLDIVKLEKMFQTYATEKGELVATLLQNDDAIRRFIKQIDTDDTYLKAIHRVNDPHARLNSHHLLFTQLLLSDRDKSLETYLDSYFIKYPDKKPFIRNVVKPHFQISDSPLVPFILIEDTDVEGLSRIFATLNTSGKLLTPFELVVAILFPQGVDLRVEISTAKKLHPTHYPNMDPTGEIALQTCVLLENGDPKKSLLPKTLTKEIWIKNKGKAFDVLDRVGEFLKTQLGMPLADTRSYTPYDSVFGPLAFVWSKLDIDSLDQSSRKKAFDRLLRYVVAASLVQRYQEGVHNKQKADGSALVAWIGADDDEKAPAWIKEATIPSLKRVTPAGALGKTILCLINRNSPKDPITNEPVPLGGSLGEDHHIFPTKFVPNLAGWDKSTMSPDIVLNIMRVAKETNAEFLDVDPRQQMLKAQEVNGVKLEQLLSFQAIPNACLQLLFKINKSAVDFNEFVRLREAEVQKVIKDEFKFPITTTEIEEADIQS